MDYKRFCALLTMALKAAGVAPEALETADDDPGLAEYEAFTLRAIADALRQDTPAGSIKAAL